jgi:ppGpp synthetase/RelA/SpoT-type nucleotidyltranferase
VIEDAEWDADELFYCPDMAWAVPQHSKSQVDGAGEVLIRDAAPLVSAAGEPFADDYQQIEELERAFAVINNWRSSHSFPLNTLQMALRRVSKEVDPHSLVAQRIKRLSSIEAKLRRFKTMKLSQMQDIGGCRAVVRSVRDVRFVVALFNDSNLKHKLHHTDDYITAPQPTGYRGVHLLWRYNSDKNTTYNGLKIEMQLRSPLQHAWATAVETVGTFIRQALKSSRGEAEWLRFFALMGSAIALRERTPLVPNTPTEPGELVKELRAAARSLDVQARLTSYGAALRRLEQPSAKKAQFFLLALDPGARSLSIIGYKSNELEQANKEYMEAERNGADAVLVSVESLAALRRAYPNYFLDTRVFLTALQQAIGGPPARRLKK